MTSDYDHVRVTDVYLLKPEEDVISKVQELGYSSGISRTGMSASFDKLTK